MGLNKCLTNLAARFSGRGTPSQPSAVTPLPAEPQPARRATTTRHFTRLSTWVGAQDIVVLKRKV
jgi:hypothetical protein